MKKREKVLLSFFVVIVMSNVIDNYHSLVPCFN